MIRFPLLLLFLLLVPSLYVAVGALASPSLPMTTFNPATGTSRAVSRSAFFLQTFHDLAAASVECSNAHLIYSGTSTISTSASNTTTTTTSTMLSIERSARDWDLKGRRKYHYYVPLSQSSLHQVSIPPFPPTPLDPTLMARCVSPSGKRSVLIYKQDKPTTATTSSTAQVRLEVFEGSKLIHRIESASHSLPHGSILVGDVTFGSPAFGGGSGNGNGNDGAASTASDTNNEDYFVYTAERLPPPSTTYWNNDNDNNKPRGTQHVLGKGISEQWGERYEDTQHVPLTDVYVLHIPTGTFVGRVPVFNDVHYRTDSTLDSICLCQPTFHPTKHHQLAMTVYDAGGLGQMNRRLGMVFCRNRHCQIVTVDIDISKLNNSNNNNNNNEIMQPKVTTTVITPDFRLARSPRYVPLLDGSVSIIFLGNPTGFHSHDGCMGLYAIDESTTIATTREIIPVQDSPICGTTNLACSRPTVLGMGFPGIFTGDLPPNCHIPATNSVLINTLWGSVSRILAVDIVTGEWDVVRLDPNENTDAELCSYSLQCIGTDMLIVTKTSSNLPEQLWQLPFSVANGKMTTGGAIQLAEFGSMACTSSLSVQQIVLRPQQQNDSQQQAPFDVEIISVTPDDATQPIHALVLLPRYVEGKVPLVVVPHGGPHSCSTSTYVPGFALLASRYAVVLPNYRGSTGFGQGPLTSLLGNIGRMDVDDVMACTQAVIDRYSDSRIDSHRIGMCGGSHGGFLTAHCTSQYPEFFKAAVMRNPVTNIASMVTSTDIHDWCHAECLGTTLDYGAIYRGPTQEEVKTMYEKSLISRISNVKTPTLIALGLKDLRVPPSQGKEWYFTLRSQGVPTELLIYPDDNHSLSGIATEADHWIRIMEWFDQYL